MRIQTYTVLVKHNSWFMKTVSECANVVVDLCVLLWLQSQTYIKQHIKSRASDTWLWSPSSYHLTMRSGRKPLSQMWVQEQGSAFHTQMGILTTRFRTTINIPCFSQVTRNEACVTIDVCPVWPETSTTGWTPEQNELARVVSNSATVLEWNETPTFKSHYWLLHQGCPEETRVNLECCQVRSDSCCFVFESNMGDD